MGAAPVPEPRNDSPILIENKKTETNSAYAVLYRLISESPMWVRIVAIFVLASAIGLSLQGKIQEMLGNRTAASESKTPDKPQPAIAIQIQNGPYAPTEGKQIDPPGNANKLPQNVDAGHHVDEDSKHYRFHEEHPEDAPDLVTIAKSDDDNYVAYKFYSKTDKCVYVLRRVNGIPTSQYVKDPQHATMAPESPHVGENRGSSEKPTGPAIVGLIDALVPSAAAAQLQFPDGAMGANLQTVQAGCTNPHRGPFSWWWGTPSDQCWSPMYRQWKDGCTHYQMFNRCANAWDGRIFWTNCNPNHYW
jgi:hypothetical protein